MIETITAWVRGWWQVGGAALRSLMIAVPLVLVLGGGYATAVWLGYATDHVSWMWQDAKDTASDARVTALEKDVADRDAVIASQAGELQRLSGINEALKARLTELGQEQVKIDESIDAANEHLREVRASDPNAPVDPADVLERLRQADAKAHRRRAR